jgi:hypothetical protein
LLCAPLVVHLTGYAVKPKSLVSRAYDTYVRASFQISYGPDTQSETGFRKAPRPIADKTALICGNYKGQ